MKPVFKCDYCNFMGTEEEVKEHEPICTDNYDRKSCYTCIHRDKIKCTEYGWTYECKEGINIPSNHVYEFCSKYERKEKPKYNFNFNNPFGWM